MFIKEQFKEYLMYDENQIKKMWKNAIFVFDTNILLNIYRYNNAAQETLLQIREYLRQQWQLRLPYQVVKEFFQNRMYVIYEQEKSYIKFIEFVSKRISDITNEAEKIWEMPQNEENIKISRLKYSNIDINQILKPLRDWTEKLQYQIQEKTSKLISLITEDPILHQIASIFDDVIWEKYTGEEIKEKEKEGEERFKNYIPPWFKDNNKNSQKKYWDLLLRFQIIDKAESMWKDIIFISDDQKEDRWLKANNKPIMPHPILKREILEKTGGRCNFHMYTGAEFLEKWELYNKKSKISISKQMIKSAHLMAYEEELEEDFSKITDTESFCNVIDKHLSKIGPIDLEYED